MSDYQDHTVPEGTPTLLPSDVSTQGGQHVHLIPLEADLQAVDPEIIPTCDLQVASSLGGNNLQLTIPEGAVGLQAASSEIEASGEFRATSSLDNLLAAHSVHKGSAAVGLQLSASVSISLLPFPSSLAHAMVANDTATCSSECYVPFPTLQRFGRNTSRLSQAIYQE
jgi:hypothetical protein